MLGLSVNQVMRAWTALGWILFIVSLIGWPITAFTIAKNEPQVILAISWVALQLAALNILVTAHTQKAQSKELFKDV